MNIPKIILIDDQCGWGKNERSNICDLFGLKDVTPGNETTRQIVDPIANVVICPGQIKQDKMIINSLALIEDEIRTDLDNWALALVDLRFVSGIIEDGNEMPSGKPNDDYFGLEILKMIKNKFPDLPTIILSAMDRSSYLKDALNNGAVDYLERFPVGSASPTETCRKTLSDRIWKHGLLQDHRESIIGNSVELKKILCNARKSSSGHSTLIIGERGSGKELLARYIHDTSSRSSKLFVPVNCAAFSESLLESELFGHEKGSFTGATQQRKGIFEYANGGTLFLDEIGYASKAVQMKLLRAIEERIISRIGSSVEIAVDVNVICATNRDLNEDARSGDFLEDLRDRINAYKIIIPPLRYRPEDIHLIANKLIDRLCGAGNARKRKFSPDALQLLLSYKWPGNIRELRNVIDRTIRNYPDLEIVMPNQLELNSSEHDFKASQNPHIGHIQLDNTDKINLQKDSSSIENRSVLLGGIYNVMEQNLDNLCIYLNKCIEHTKKANGDINITAAYKIMTNDMTKKTQQAADFFIKCFKDIKDKKDIIPNVLRKYPNIEKALMTAKQIRKDME